MQMALSRVWCTGAAISIRLTRMDQSQSARVVWFYHVQMHLWHVRAATPDSVAAEENCHPSAYGPFLFQHNGHVEGFEKIKRRIMNALPDELYKFPHYRFGGVLAC